MACRIAGMILGEKECTLLGRRMGGQSPGRPELSGRVGGRQLDKVR